MSRFYAVPFQGIHLAPWVQQWFGLPRQADPLYQWAAPVAAHIFMKPCHDVRHRLRMSQQQVSGLLYDCPVWGQVCY